MLQERSFKPLKSPRVVWKLCLFCQITEKHIMDRHRVLLAANLEDRERNAELRPYREPMPLRDVLDELFSAQILREKVSA